MYSRILDLSLGSRAGDFTKSPGHFPECDVMGEGVGVYSRILNLPPVRDIRHETCQNSESNTFQILPFNVQLGEILCSLPNIYIVYITDMFIYYEVDL